MSSSQLSTNSQFSEASLIISGPAGALELHTATLTVDAGAPAPVAVVCHPHPLYGGSLRNKVVHTLAKGFNELGAHSVRFNFRGVGRSMGEFDEGIGETDDLLAVVKWARTQHPASPLWLAGFSFGAYVALRSVERMQAERLLLVAPPVSLFNFSGLPEVEIPWMVMQGGEDEIIESSAVDDWVRQRRHPPQYCRMDEAGHFFHAKLNVLKQQLTSNWPKLA